MPIRLTRKNCIFTRRFNKQLSKIDPVVKRAIEMKLAEILDENASAQLKKLTDYPYADFRIKIGDYRLLIVQDKKRKTFYFNECKNRKDLY